MTYLQIILFLAGVVLLLAGYRRNHRKLMLVATIVLCLAGSADQLVGGFVTGVKQVIVESAAH